MFYSEDGRVLHDNRLADDWLRALYAIGIASLLIGMSVTAHLITPLLAIPACILVSCLLANYYPGVAVVSVVFALLFQNLFVSLVSSGLETSDDFKVIRGYNFVILLSVWSTIMFAYLTQLRRISRSIDKIMKVTFLVLALAFFYFLIGAAQNPMGAVIYLRNIASPIMLFQLMLLVFWRFETRLSPALMIVAGAFILFGYIELFYRDEWLRLINGNAYWDLEMRKERLSLAWDTQARETGRVTKGFIDTITVDLFNTPLLGDLKLKVARLMGPNMHSISYSYAMAFLLIFTLFRGAIIPAVLIAPLLIFANAKGALIVVVLVSFAWIAFKILGSRISFAGLSLVLLLYSVAGVLVGLNIGDFHVLGFMGGVHNFLQFPVGHGIGVGGNLSTDFSKLDWPAYQALGRTPVAIESAVGVLLYQMGPAAFLLLGIYAWIAWLTGKVASLTGLSIHAAASFALLTVLVNGIFQEEALFSPIALGLFVSLNGMILGQAVRKGIKI